MKTFVTFFFILFIGFAAQAQDRVQEVKVATIQMEVVHVAEIQQNQTEKATEVARLYRRSGSRVKKALHFTTTKDRQYA